MSGYPASCSGWFWGFPLLERGAEWCSCLTYQACFLMKAGLGGFVYSQKQSVSKHLCVRGTPPPPPQAGSWELPATKAPTCRGNFSLAWGREVGRPTLKISEAGGGGGGGVPKRATWGQGWGWGRSVHNHQPQACKWPFLYEHLSQALGTSLHQIPV